MKSYWKIEVKCRLDSWTPVLLFKYIFAYASEKGLLTWFCSL